jgi:uncharacterized protein DUF4389
MSHAYPVRVEGRLDPGLSRWLWLVKWLLVIPHYIVLAFLWVAFVVLSIVAFFAILFTGRYPRAIFDFNVGVLRWSWRVGFYAFAANGTDHYPPFTLATTEDYPAELTIDYPDRLSRGLVLVKWWLLAIPHYIVVGIFIGGGTWIAWHADEHTYRYGGGLVGVLVLIAVLALLFSGRYPRGIFDLVLGMNRWALRVAAYAGLMTDRYPPFRLDLGGDEPDVITVPDNVSPAPAATGWTPGRVLLLITGSLVALIAAALLAAGVAAVVVDQVARDDGGFVMSPTRTFTTGTYALVSERATADLSGPDWVADDVVGTVQLRGDGRQPLFIGIGPAAEVDQYLASVAHKELNSLDSGHGTVVGGRDRPAPPASQGFWVATGERTVRWDLQSGDWRAVVMNADGTSGVTADLSIGARLPDLAWWGVGLLAGGAVALVIASLMLVGAVRRRPRGSAPDPTR